MSKLLIYCIHSFHIMHFLNNLYYITVQKLILALTNFTIYKVFFIAIYHRITQKYKQMLKVPSLDY